MLKKQPARTVQFGQLSADHKAEFIQFLIKNNICFQEGKENCIAQVALNKSNPTPSKNQVKVSNLNVNKTQPSRQKPAKKISANKKSRPQGLRQIKDVLNRPMTPIKTPRQPKTPTKCITPELQSYQISRKGRSQTLKKPNQRTNSACKPICDENSKQNVKQKRAKSNTAKCHTEVFQSRQSKQVDNSYREKQNVVVKNKQQAIISRERMDVKYVTLFDLQEQGRAVRWPINILQKTIEDIYDEVFAKNTQSLSRNIVHALKSLTSTAFPKLVQAHFRKKSKNNKTAATNLNNMLYTLSLSINRQSCSPLTRTFEDFLTGKFQHQDLLYYLFIRNIMKREMRAVEKCRDSTRSEGSYFNEKIKNKDISRCLKAIIGNDCELIEQYSNLVSNKTCGDAIQVYEFLRIMVGDYNSKRLNNEEIDNLQSPLFQRDPYEGRSTDQLTFGEQEHENHPSQILQNNLYNFWKILSYHPVSDDLFDLIMQKMGRKVVEFIAILAQDLEKPPKDLQTLQKLLLIKAEGLLHAVFEMNKMKWFKELAIAVPNDDDMNTVQDIQMRLRVLKDRPSVRGIGQFCKALLTTQNLVNQLQLALTNVE